MAKKLLSDCERFCQSIKRTDNGCWEWQRAKDKDGYGLFKVGSHTDRSRRMARAHRWAYEQFVCEIPNGLQIDHLCRNRCCVNPEHMEPVTGLINAQRGWRANKTECKFGHPLAGDNLYIAPDGKRGCKICRVRRVIQFITRRGGREYQRAYEREWRKRRRLSA